MKSPQPKTQPKAAKPKLRPLQIECVDKLEKFINTVETCAVYNGSEMGTGKSAETIELLRRIQARTFGGCETCVLIVCPKVVKLNWRDEIKMWWPKDVGIWVIDSEKQFLEGDGFLTAFNIITYNLLMNPLILKKLKSKKVNIDVLVLDEVQKVRGLRDKTKEKGTPTMKAAVLDHIWPRCRFKICLSGTPFVSSILDCYTVFNRILPKKFPNYYAFANTYCYQDDTPFGLKYYGLRNHEKLKKIIRSNFFVRYTKEQMAPELPEKIWTRIPLGAEYRVKLSKEELIAEKNYELACEDFILTGNGKPPTPPKAIATQRKEQGLKKLPAVSEFVKELVDNQIPTLLFCLHIEVLKNLEKTFKKFNPAVIYGATSDEERAKAIKRFQSGDTDLFLGQIHAAGIGCNLTRAECVVLAENVYEPGTVAQAVDRAHRIGQTKSVNVYWFVVEGTLDEKITKNCMIKARNFKLVLQ